MDVKSNNTTSLLEQRPEFSAPIGTKPSGNLLAEMTPSPADALLPKVSNGEHTENFDLGDKMMPIAIIGIGCRFPQDATSPEKLWDMMLCKRSARSDIPSNRFNVDAFYHPDSMSNRGGHFLKQDLAAFDAPFFSISPAEAKSMDPMQRILLEVVYEAIENAGISMAAIAGSNTSCYVGCFTDDYDGILKRDSELSPKYHAVGTGAAILSNRISFFLDLKGPSMTINTACSSSLVAIHLACQSLRTGESKAAIVGATNAVLSPDMHVGMSSMHFLSPDSICYAFDERANGYARGEGMAALILKPLEDAIRDGDTIRAVIRGSATNQDGKTAGITLPSKAAQISLIQTAYEQAGCDPSLTGYFEAHGTGTPAGDPIEASAIGATLGQCRPGEGEEGKLYVGSIKTNIGHLEGASGLAGLIKAVLSMEKGIILPNLWFENGNRAIDFDGWRIRVPTEPVPWPVAGLRRASINSFGYGGTNSHTIIDDAYHYLLLRGLEGNHCTTLKDDVRLLSHNQIASPAATDQTPSPPQPNGYSRSGSHGNFDIISGLEPAAQKHKRGPRIFHLASHEEGVALTSAAALAEHLASRVEENEDAFLDDLSYTLCDRRSRLPWGCSVVAATIKEVVERLRAPSLKAIRQLNSVPRLAFIFTGQGAQWWGMGRELLIYPVFADILEKCDTAVKGLGSSWSLLEELHKDEGDSRINEAAISQPLCTAVQIALATLYASWNIHALKVVGHSSGEIAAAYTIGALSIESAMQVAYFRGLFSSQLKEYGHRGAMMAVNGISELEVNDRIAALGCECGKVVVACVNSPVSITVSGDESAIVELQQTLMKDGLYAKRLRVDTAYHSHHMLSISESYRQSLSNLKLTPKSERKSVDMISTVTGQSIAADEQLDADYWVKNMLSCIRFAGALENVCTPQSRNEKGRRTSKRGGVDILIELGPHSALAGPVKQVLAGMTSLPSASILYHSALMREQDASVTALDVVASLFARGYPLNLRATQSPDPSQTRRPMVVVNLPSYCWNHTKTYWSESRLSVDYRFRQFPRNDILGAQTPDWNPTEPRWRNCIRLSEQPWIKGHQVQGTVIYPAAGYICMALEAARQMSAFSLTAKGSAHGAISGYIIRELAISRALMVPETEDGVETVFSMRPYATSSIASSDAWHEFHIFSHNPNRGWNEHCRGLVSVDYARDATVADEDAEDDEIMKEFNGKLEAAKLSCALNIDCNELYEFLAASGLWYGPEFRNIVEIATGGGQALGMVKIPDTRSVMPKEYEFDHFLHPATMDSFLQMIMPALVQGDMKSVKDPYIPTFMEEMYFSADMSAKAGHNFHVISEARFQGFRDAFASIVILDGITLAPIIRINGAKCMALTASGSGKGADKSENAISKHCFSVMWEPDVDILTKSQWDEVLRDPLGDKIELPPGRIPEFEMLARYFFEQVIKKISDEDITGMLEHQRVFFRFIQHQHEVVLAGENEYQTPEWKKFDEPHVATGILQLIDKISTPEDVEGRMFVRMGQALTSILRQEIDALALMMEDNLLHDYYAASIRASMTYAQIERYFTLLSHKNPDLEYLEIGAGTGGATIPTLHALGGYGKHKYPRLKSYTYTDISSGFFEAAGKKFGDWSDLMRFCKLDVEQDPDKQGFENQQYDVILAANVLHATHSIDRTLKNVRKLLKPGGKLILVEITHSLLSISLIFGNLPGWWMSAEPWRQMGPVLDEHRWRDALQQTGFSDLQVSVPDVLNPLEHVNRVMVATAVEDADKNGLNKSVPMPLQSVILVCPDKNEETSQDLVNGTQCALESRGISVDLSSIYGLGRIDLHGKICIVLAELGDALLPDISPSDFTTLQRLSQEPVGVIWMTRGGTANTTSPDHSLFHGLARSLRSEQEGFPCVTIDLDPMTKLPQDATVELLMNVFQQIFIPGKASEMKDREFSERDGVLCIKRVVEDESINRHIAVQTNSVPLVPESQLICQPDRPLKLANGAFGTLNSLFFEDDPAICGCLPDDHVEIEVRAVGLNSRDVHIWTGELSNLHLGMDCAGVVSRVGSSILNLSVGDRVNTLCVGCFSSSLRGPADYVQRIPDSMSFTAAASLPLVYVAAYYGLCHLAHLRSGESVLIHAAAGGVGQAAIQIAKMIGAEIFVTVGTEEKKKHLSTTYSIAEDHIFSSRYLSFASRIMRLTGGRGVDVVLNTLAGEALKTTWRCIAFFGRFIEMGKTDFEDNGRLDMAPFRKNVTFASVDVTLILKHNRELGAKLFSEVMKLVRDKSVKEPSPITVYPFSQIEDSFRLMQAGKHIGKIVLEPREGDFVQVMPRPSSGISFPSDASYLLAGGLGGLGRSISRWMVSKGARNLIYVSRSGVSSPEAVKFVDGLTAAGVCVQVLRCDITDGQKLSASLNSTLETMPPIRGVIQGAMVLKDQVFSNMSFETFMNTIRPKVHGSWSLHEATLDQPLDFFVLLSSAAGFIGNAGQSNYTAACTYQVALAAYRHSQGLPATAIDIGKIASVGFVAENIGTMSEQNLVRIGMLDTSEKEFLAMVELAMVPQSHGEGNRHVITSLNLTVSPGSAEQELPFWTRDPVFSHMECLRPHLVRSARSTTVTEGSSQQSLSTLLSAASSLSDAVASVLDAFLRKLSRSLMMPLEDIDVSKSTAAYGIDSLIAVDIRNWIFREAKADVPVFEILQAFTPTTLAQKIVDKSTLVSQKLKSED